MDGGRGTGIDKAALSYCSPQLTTIHGVEQILLATDAGLSAFEPASGRELWHHSWPAENAARIVQPALVGDGDVLIGTESARDASASAATGKPGSRKRNGPIVRSDCISMMSSLSTAIFTASTRANSCALA